LALAAGRHVDADLLFGCDGAWSKVRPFLATTKPYYCGITIVETWISSVDTRHPGVAELVGPGIFLATSDDKALIGQRNGDGNIRVYVTLRVPEDWTQRCGFAFNQPDLARQGLLKIFEGWAPHLREMLKAAEVFIPRSLYTHPPRQAAWLARTDVTLLGDAAHVMPFFTGRGVNLAMLDAAELADNLTSGKFSDLGQAIRAYETSMRNRMAVEINETLTDQDVFISRDAPAGIEDLLRRRIQAGQQRKAKP
jgi:2-polyprenyl-6-methoxyphenol hydroxylase-like FAD-dependent oxidoreductase